MCAEAIELRTFTRLDFNRPYYWQFGQMSFSEVMKLRGSVQRWAGNESRCPHDPPYFAQRCLYPILGRSQVSMSGPRCSGYAGVGRNHHLRVTCEATMEIHAPHQPILTLREALVHLSIVTVGILIALSLEGTREWYEHRAQVVEARRNILEEIRSNRKSLEEGFLKKAMSTRKDAAQAANVAQSLLDHTPGASHAWQSDYPLVVLQSASFTTAQVSGVFALMDYGEVRKYAALYRMQDTFERLHAEGMATGLQAFAIGRDITKAAGSSTRQIPEADIREWKRLIGVADSSILLQSQVGTSLDAEYAKAVGESPSQKPE
jgi:Tfp pilus assembly protein PilV